MTEPDAAGADETGSWAGHPRGSRGYRRILIALACAGLATFAQLYSVQGVLPLIAQDLGISAADAALSVSAATLGLALAVIPWSQVADRVGRLRAMTAAVVLATLLGLLVPLAPSFPALLALRFGEGVALGGIPALALAYLSEEVSRLHAAVAAGTYVAGTTVGGLAGRVISAPVGDLLNWRIGLVAVSLLAAAAAVCFIATAPKQRGFTPPVRPPGGPPREDRLWYKLRVNLQDRGLIALYLQGFLLMGGFVAVYNYLGFHLGAEPFGLPQSVVSLLFLAYLSGTWSSRAAGSAAAKWGRRRVLLLSTGAMALGMAVTFIAWLPAVLAGLLVFTAGFFAAHSVASGWTPFRSRHGRAQASSLYNLFYYAGSSLLGWAGGLFFQSLGWNALAVFVLALLAVAAAFSVFALPAPAAGN